MKLSKIKIIGQPMYNIGDLAACKSLTRLLSESLEIEVDYPVFFNREIDPEFLKIKNANFYKGIQIPNKYEKLFSILFPKLLKVILKVFPKHKNKYNELLNSDFVLFSPGGLEFGLYKEWSYLWILSVLVAFNKDFGLYSRSIGNFQNKTLGDKIFKQQTIKLLRKSKFNGIRDLKSQEQAQEFNIPFFPSIDVVFSNVPDYENLVLTDIGKEILKNEFIVFTPSSFEWHPTLSLYPREKYIAIYLEIMNTIIHNTNNNLVMLPHIYKDNKDAKYFNELKNKCSNSDRVIILDDNPNSDLYQYIISKAILTIAARSHQVIFAINNHTPFICLSYEHKMEDMLRILDLEKYSFRILDIVENSGVISELISTINTHRLDKSEVANAQQKAQTIALESFDKFIHSSNNK